LLRYFSLTSLVGIFVAVLALLGVYRYLAAATLIEHETRNNAALTRVFANTVWPDHAVFLSSAGRLPREQLARRTEIAALRADVLRQMKGLSVVKVKVYDLNGVTVFSTDPKQIGEDKRSNSGFQSARAGATASEVTFRDQFDAFEGVIVDRNLVSSYVPVRRDDTAPVEAVMEVYSDVSALVAQLERTQWQVAGAVLGSFSLLYFFLYLIVRRADRIIRERDEQQSLATQEKLRYQAYHDALTGLPNRNRFAERLEEAILGARRTGTTFAVLFVDLDHFKYINDSLGHHIGDLLLQAVGERLKRGLRASDIVARIGGDEFIMLLGEVGRIEFAARVAEKLRDSVANPSYPIEGHELRVTPSIGISIFPDDGQDAATLIKNADAAMYHAKGMGRNNFQFYAREMNARAFAVVSLEHSLQRAMERDEFVLHYQPQVELASGRLVGAEALVRWQHPEMGLVLPVQFISVAEERGLIVPIGDWVLRQACQRNRAWHDAGLPRVPVSVNVSPLQFRQRDFAERVAAALEGAGLAAEFLELEITESVIMHSIEAAMKTVHALKAMGVRLSIDDFGAGHAGFGYLKQFPVGRLKLDQSFVRGLPSDVDDVAIATAVLGMAHALRLKVIAEGVETEAQVNFLRARECDQAQGYYFSQPLPAEEFAALVAALPGAVLPARALQARN
jgi:diguanylate cyclase (GGDEF)-like protein